MNLGKTLQQLRKEKNISQEDMADMLNVTRQTISNWENSKSYPDILALIKLCDIYKISLDDLLKEDEQLLKHIKLEKQKKNRIIITCISIITLLTLILSYFVFFKDYFETTNTMKKEINMVIDNYEKFVEITKSKQYNEDEMTDNYMKISDAEFKNITTYLKKNSYKYETVFRFTNFHIESTDTIGFIRLNDIMKINDKKETTPFTFWPAECDIIKYDDFNNFFETNIIGRSPSNDKEIMISNVLANFIIYRGINTPKGEYYPKNYEEIINHENYYFGDDKVKITGIINYDLSRFDEIKEISWDELNKNYQKYGKIYDSFLLNVRNIYNKIYVDESFISNLEVDKEENQEWRRNITRTGILVIENDKNKLTKLFRKFNKKPYEVKTSYSELFKNK